MLIYAIPIVIVVLLVLIGRAIWPLVISNMKTKSVNWGLGADIKLTELKKPVTYVVDLQGKAQQSATLKSLLGIACSVLLAACVAIALLWLTTEGLAAETQQERQKADMAAQEKVQLEQAVTSLRSEREQLTATLSEKDEQIVQLQSALNETQAELDRSKSAQTTDQIPQDLATILIALTAIIGGCIGFLLGHWSGNHSAGGAGRTRQYQGQRVPVNGRLPPPRVIGARVDARVGSTASSSSRQVLKPMAPNVVPGLSRANQHRESARLKRDATIVAAAWAIVAAMLGALIMTGVVSCIAPVIGVDGAVTQGLDVGAALFIIITGLLIAALTFVGLRSYMLRSFDPRG